MKRLVMIGGCPRSGTTALTRLLNCHAEVLIGNERYYRVIERGELTADHFERERFLRIEDGDTHDEPPGLVTGEAAHWLGEDAPVRYDGASVIGDKYPPLFRSFRTVAERLPALHIVYVLRNPLSVAESYQARAVDAADRWPFDFARAVRDWNDSLVAAATMLDEGLTITIVAYERILASAEAAAALVARLGLRTAWRRPIDEILERAAELSTKPVPRSEAIRQHVALTADFGTYRALMARAI